jgi:phosphocarrier protein HPr
LTETAGPAGVNLPGRAASPGIAESIRQEFGERNSQGPESRQMPMNPPTSFVRRDADITDALGLHMRAADKFVRVAQQFRAEIRVRYAGKEANGKSILDLMTLAAECGSRLRLEARGQDAMTALAALVDLVSGGSDEAEG